MSVPTHLPRSPHRPVKQSELYIARLETNTYIVLLFVLCQHLPDRHQETIPSIFDFERLRHNIRLKNK